MYMEKMQAILLDLNEAIQHPDITVFETILSFRPFIDFLRQSAEEAEPAKAAMLRAALGQFTKHPELMDTLPVTDAYRYPGILEQVRMLLTPALSGAKEDIWALSLPATPYIFYGTQSFYNLLSDTATGLIIDNILDYSTEQWKEKRLTNIYGVILQKL